MQCINFPFQSDEPGVHTSGQPNSTKVDDIPIQKKEFFSVSRE